jgi:hypothetical protein
MLPSFEEGTGNIVHGLIALVIGFSCIALAIKPEPPEISNKTPPLMSVSGP